MGRRSLLAVLAAAALVSWATAALAGEGAEADRRKAREERAARARGGRQPLTAEEMAKRTERMKAALKQRVTYMTRTIENLQTRREELTAMAAKPAVSVAPPSSQLFSAQGARGGRASAMRMAYRRRPGADPAAPRPGTLEAPNTEDLKKAIAGAGDAYAALLPLLEEQRQAAQKQIAEGGAQPGRGADREAARAAMEAARKLSEKMGDAQTAVGNAEAEIDLLLAKAWLEAAAAKATTDDAKAAVAAAQAALTEFLALRPQLAELEQKIGEQSTALQDSLRKIMGGFARQRAGGRPGAPREPGEGRRRRPPDGAAPAPRNF